MADAVSALNSTLQPDSYLNRAVVLAQAKAEEILTQRESYDLRIQEQADGKRVRDQTARRQLDREQAARDFRTEADLRHAQELLAQLGSQGSSTVEPQQRLHNEQRYRYAFALDVEHRAYEPRYEQIDKSVRGDILDVEA